MKPTPENAMQPNPNASGTRLERQLPKRAEAPPAAVPGATVVQGGAPSLNALPPDERRLVALCCAMRGREAPELLKMLAPQQAPAAVEAGESIAILDRSARVSLLARNLSPNPGDAQVRRLADALRRQPSWAGTLAAQFVPASARRALPVARPRPNPAHPALESWVRRLVARALQ